MTNKQEYSDVAADSSDTGFTVNPVKQSVNLSSMSIQSAYSGPLPTPEMMAGYGNLDPSFPERIMKMAENLCQAQVTVVNAEFGVIIAAMSFIVWRPHSIRK